MATQTAPGIPGTMSTGANGAVANDFEALKHDFTALKDSVSQLLKNVTSEGKSRAQAAGHAIGDKAKEGLGVAEDRIRERPLLSVLIALLVGIIVGRIVLRS